MKTKFIKTEKYYLLVYADADILKGDWWLETITNTVIQKASDIKYSKGQNAIKIIAHFPIGNNPQLEGVDLLPELSRMES